ncbi:MAG: hypothetical protein RL885_22335 [Planctomycetota bacterium]
MRYAIRITMGLAVLGLAACGDEEAKRESHPSALIEPEASHDDSARSLPELTDSSESRETEESTPELRLTTEPRQATDGALIPEHLRAWARREIENAILARRPAAPEKDVDALVAEFERQVLALPRELAGRFAEDQERIEKNERVVQSGEAVELMSRWASAQLELPADYDQARSIVDRVLTPRAPRGRLSGLSLAAKSTKDRDALEIDDGTVVEFPAGVFQVDTTSRTFREEWAKDVTIRGAGMDATLLQLEHDFSMRGNVERLRIEDLTLDGSRHGVFDLRTGSLVLDIERVRIVGFDRGAGGSNIFSVAESPSLIRARQCRFEGGYGRSPGGGHLFRWSAKLLASFEDCRFETFFLVLDDASRTESRLLFQNCSFDRMRDDFTKSHSGVQLRGSRIGEPFDPRKVSEYRRDLKELFPDAR